MDFFLQDWHFWSQELPDSATNGQASYPELQQIPALQRRRLSDLTKISLHLAFAHQIAADTPVVFASRHGDLHKTSQLLKQVATDDDVSPTQFALSVHNAMVGQYSILTQHQAQHSSVAAADASLHYGVLEAWTLLQCNECDQVLVVYADQRLPDIYADFDTHPTVDHGMSLLLSKNPVGSHLRLLRQSHNQLGYKHEAFELQRFLQGTSPNIQITTRREQWCWQRLS